MENTIYKTKKEKIIDFLIGSLVFPLVVYFVHKLFPYIVGHNRSLAVVMGGALSIVELGVLLYLCAKRKFILIGFLFLIGGYFAACILGFILWHLSIPK